MCPRGTEQLARAMFGPEQLADVLEVIGWYDGVQADDVHRAVLSLGKADMDALLDLVAAAVEDFRDVLMWASLREPTAEERAAARATVDELARAYTQAQRRYLVARFGAQGAEQIERGNENRFLNLRQRSQGGGDRAGSPGPQEND